MKKTMRIISIPLISILLVLVSVINIFAATVLEIDGYILKVEDHGTTILSGWNGDNTNMVVPLSIRNNYIKEVESFAFENNEKLLSLDLNSASSLKKIGVMAFKGCKNLSGSITIPGRIREIGMGAFQECIGITDITYHAGPSSVPIQMFYSCSSLKNVFISSGVSSIGKLAFADCTSLESVTIPKSVTSIDSTAFKNDNNLTINGYRDSYAQQFAQDNGYDFYILDPLLGDSNGDGNVDIMDATYIQKYKIGAQGYDLTEYQRRCADVNRDGNVTVRDATLIQMKLAKYDVDF